MIGTYERGHMEDRAPSLRGAGGAGGLSSTDRTASLISVSIPRIEIVGNTGGASVHAYSPKSISTVDDASAGEFVAESAYG